MKKLLTAIFVLTVITQSANAVDTSRTGGGSVRDSAGRVTVDSLNNTVEVPLDMPISANGHRLLPSIRLLSDGESYYPPGPQPPEKGLDKIKRVGDMAILRADTNKAGTSEYRPDEVFTTVEIHSDGCYTFSTKDRGWLIDAAGRSNKAGVTDTLKVCPVGSIGAKSMGGFKLMGMALASGSSAPICGPRDGMTKCIEMTPEAYEIVHIRGDIDPTTGLYTGGYLEQFDPETGRHM